MLVFGHKQLSLIILFLLSLPVPPASSLRSRPPNPPVGGAQWVLRGPARGRFHVTAGLELIQTHRDGELTPGPGLSGASDKRLYVLMASFSWQNVFKGLGVVKSKRH